MFPLVRASLRLPLVLIPVAVALSSCSAPDSQTDSSTTPTPAGATPGVTPTAKPASTPSLPKPAAAPTLLAPGSDDLLHPIPFKWSGDGAAALNKLLQAAPEYYPKGTKVLAVRDEGEKVVVELSEQFNDQQFYSRGERITELAVYALVNSASTFARKAPAPVELKAGGQPLSTLGELDASGAIDPDKELTAAP